MDLITWLTVCELFFAQCSVLTVGLINMNDNFLMQRDEGIQIVSEAICSGIFNDLGSGSNVDVCVITKVCYLNCSIWIPTKNAGNFYLNIAISPCPFPCLKIHFWNEAKRLKICCSIDRRAKWNRNIYRGWFVFNFNHYGLFAYFAHCHWLLLVG